jgi:V/A-type H+-transporting ATPase subunit I
MIIEMEKYLIYGTSIEMERFFELAQRAGFLEFIGLSKKTALELPLDAKTLLSAIKIARHHAPDAHEPLASIADPLKYAEEIVLAKSTHEKLLEEERLARAEISRISIFGDFSKRELIAFEKESKRVFQFFCMKSDLAREISLPDGVIFVGTEYDLDYFVSIQKERILPPKMIEILIEKPVGELKKRLSHIQEEASQIERRLHDSANALPLLQNALFHALNEYNLRMAKHDAAIEMNDSLFAIEAWVPKTKIKALYGLLSSLAVHSEPIAIEPRDKIPTYIENKGVGKLGEDLVHVYDTPAQTDKDPSRWVLVFFSLFFAMIVSDAGYGLIYLLIGLYLKKKFSKASGSLKRLINLTMIMGTCCIIWGVLTASFFGIEIGPDNPFRKTSFLHSLAVRKADYHIEQKDDVYREYAHEYPAAADATDGHDFLVKGTRIEDGSVKYAILDEFCGNILLEFSLMMGVFHISLSFLRYLFRNWTGLGWIVFMIGGYLYFPSMLDATSILNFMGWITKSTATAIGQPMLYAGLILVLTLAILQGRRWGALHELTNAVQVFADVLSYLRLYALALAGMIMASTFNRMGLDLGLGIGIFVIAIGHIVNMTLGIMGGVIHGLRLNFLEWYHYSFEGGGRLFNPLRLRKMK